LALAYAYIALYFVVAQNTIEGLIEYIEKSDVTRIEKKRRPQLFQDFIFPDITRKPAYTIADNLKTTDLEPQESKPRKRN